MYGRFYSFFDKKKLFYSKQFGFLSKRTSLDALAEIAEQIRQVSAKTFTCILFELRKVFESNYHEVL